MKKIISFLIICFLVLLINIYQPSRINARSSWETISHDVIDMGFGLTYENYKGISFSDVTAQSAEANRTQEIYTLNLAPNAQAKLVVWEKSGVNNSWGLTSIEDIARDYEAKHPDKVVLAATNNWLAWTLDNNRGEIKSCQIAGGLNFRVRDLQGTTTNVEGSFGDGYSPQPNMLGYDLDGNYYFCEDWNNGENYTDHLCLSTYTDELHKQDLNFTIDKINILPDDGEVAIIFPNYDGLMNLDGATIYQMNAIKMRYDNIKGTTTFVERDAFAWGNFDQIVTKMDFYLHPNSYYFASRNATFNSLMETNLPILAQYELLGEYKNVIGATSYFTRIIREGVAYPGDYVYPPDGSIHPRTVFYATADGGMGLSVIDGRHPDKGHHGMSYEEMGYFYKTYYNAYQCFNHDGGGSSCIVLRDVEGHLNIMNDPSDGHQRGVANATLVVVDRDPFTIEQVGYDPYKVTLKLNLLKDDIHNVTVNLDGQTYQFNNQNELVIDNLDSHQKYELHITYENMAGASLDGFPLVVNTSKRMTTLKTFKVIEVTENKAIIQYEIDDPDEALSFIRIKFNGKTTTIYEKSGTYTLDNLLPNSEYEVILSVFNNINNSNDIEEFKLNFSTASLSPGQKKKGCKAGAVSLALISISVGSILIILRKKRS